MFLTGSAIFALEYILCCFDTDKSGSNSYFQVALLLSIRNDQCCSKLFSYTEKIRFSCSRNEQHFSIAKGTGRGRWAAAKGKTSAQLPVWAELLSHRSCDGSINWIQDFSIGGGVLASFALLKVFVS